MTFDEIEVGQVVRYQYEGGYSDYVIYEKNGDLEDDWCGTVYGEYNIDGVREIVVLYPHEVEPIT